MSENEPSMAESSSEESVDVCSSDGENYHVFHGDFAPYQGELLASSEDDDNNGGGEEDRIFPSVLATFRRTSYFRQLVRARRKWKYWYEPSWLTCIVNFEEWASKAVHAIFNEILFLDQNQVLGLLTKTHICLRTLRNLMLGFAQATPEIAIKYKLFFIQTEQSFFNHEE